MFFWSNVQIVNLFANASCRVPIHITNSHSPGILTMPPKNRKTSRNSTAYNASVIAYSSVL